MKFSEKLRQIRKEKGLSQEELSDLVDVSRQSVSKWESGQAYPEIEKLIILSDLFEVSMDELIKGQTHINNGLDKNIFEDVVQPVKDKKHFEWMLVIIMAALIILSKSFPKYYR